MDLFFKKFIESALQEDVGEGDYSSLACIAANAQGEAVLKVKQAGILSGLEEAVAIFNYIDATLNCEILLKDGTSIQPGDIAFVVKGNVRSILKAERLVLNVMQRMSGIATLTHQFVAAAHPHKARILDTRKTVPNFRYFEKKAVKTGGGSNHRFGLYDMIMLKDNHIDFAGSIEKAINATQNFLKQENLDLKIEIEAKNMDDVKEILRIGQVHRIMLDNFKLPEMYEAISLINGNYETEISGGVNLENVAKIAATGVDFISVGMITHGAKALDLSLKAKMTS